MKLKTNKLLTLTLATGLVAMTAGCGGGSKTPAATGGGNNNQTTDPDPVTYAEWAAGTTQATVIADNAFLASVTTDADGLDIPTQTPPITPTVMTLNLNSQYAPADTTSGAELTPVILGGEAADGVAFFTHGDTDDARYFAGLHFSTDLGVPVATTGATATWENGFFQAIGANAVAKSFSLTVNFVAAQISGIVPVGTNTYGTDGDLSYFFVGDYDGKGVITGDIILRDLATDNDDDDAARADGVVDLTAALVTGAASPATDGIGTLTGLIGVDGVVGAFHSTADGATDGYAGGFVVSTEDNTGGTDPDVLYADWAAGATQAAVLTDNAFLASATGDPDGLVFPAPTTAPDVATLNLAAETHPAGTAKVDGVAGTVAMNAGTAGVNARTLGGAATNGVAFFTTGADAEARYFAGLHFGTNLGRPVLTTGAEATWNGLIQAVSGTTTSAFDAKIFELTVNFGTTDATRTISAHVAAAADFTTESYYLSGTYDADGVITGTVSRGVIAAADTATATANGTLTGLIGLTGAVGAFHSTGTDGDGATGYAGGFVAIPTAIPDATADEPTPYAGTTVGYAGLSGVATVADLTANGFLASTTPDALTYPVPSSSPPAPTVLNLGTGLEGGVSFFTNGAAATAFFFAGIHNDTNLGSPVVDTTPDATWSGTFQAVGTTGAATITAAKDIELAVGFGSATTDRTITGSVAAGAATVDAIVAGTTPAYHISATYTAAGLISGNILYQSAANSEVTATGIASAAAAVAATAGGGTITGLIGQSGLVGAFHSSNSTDGLTGILGYAGGFIATP